MTTSLSCTCPDHIYRGGLSGHQCKHVQAVLKAIREGVPVRLPVRVPSASAPDVLYMVSKDTTASATVQPEAGDEPAATRKVGQNRLDNVDNSRIP